MESSAYVFLVFAAIIMIWLVLFSSSAQKIEPTQISDSEQKTEPTQISEQGSSSRSYNSEYRVAFLLSKLITILGWIVFVIGIVMIVVGFISSFSYGVAALVAGVMSGFQTSCGGLFIVVSGQMMRALIDTADNTRKILISMNDRKI